MSTVIRKLAWSRLADPKVAITVSGAGLLLGMLVGAMAPNAETLPIRLPLSSLLPSLAHHVVLASVMLYPGNILACLGLAGMLWAHSQGMAPQSASPAAGKRGHRRGHGQPDPRRLIGYRELRRVRSHSGAGRGPVHDQPAGMG
jgi:hypothetical protein